MTKRVAVIGAGPAGFYATDALTTAGFEVDLLERLPSPYGLVRAGVAPDHPKIKSVTRVYDRIAAHAGCRYFGGVCVGEHLTRDALLRHYHAIIYATGAIDGRALGIPGEGLRGSHTATAIVGWYNGHPDHVDVPLDLDAERAVVIGNGNVALDVARMLVLDRGELSRTDVPEHVVNALAASRIREVTVVGRRTPRHASFTTQELRELGQLADVGVVVENADLTGQDDETPAVRRNLDALRDLRDGSRPDRPRRIVLSFLRSPVQVLGDADGRVAGLRVARTRIDAAGAIAAVDGEETIDCELVVSAIGFGGTPLPDVPFDAASGTIPNAGGRVLGAGGTPLVGEYAAGWVKRGPSGVIGTNKLDAVETVRALIDDAAAGRLNDPPHPAPDAIADQLRSCCPNLCQWSEWQSIDRRELAAGQRLGRPRVKLATWHDLHASMRTTDHRAAAPTAS